MNFSNGLCHFCKTEVEDTRHIFYTCPISFEVVKQVQEKIKMVLVDAGGQNLNLDSHQVILGYKDGSKELNIFC